MCTHTHTYIVLYTNTHTFLVLILYINIKKEKQKALEPCVKTIITHTHLCVILICRKTDRVYLYKAHKIYFLWGFCAPTNSTYFGAEGAQHSEHQSHHACLMKKHCCTQTKVLNGKQIIEHLLAACFYMQKLEVGIQHQQKQN